MDIEPLWDLGGWFIFPKNYCMATPRTQSPATETFTKILLLSALIFVFFLLVSPANLINPSYEASSSSTSAAKRALLESKESSSTSTNSMDLHPKQAHNSHGSSSKSRSPVFGAEEHEVPSGPNPISNR